MVLRSALIVVDLFCTEDDLSSRSRENKNSD